MVLSDVLVSFLFRTCTPFRDDELEACDLNAKLLYEGNILLCFGTCLVTIFLQEASVAVEMEYSVAIVVSKISGRVVMTEAQPYPR